MPKGTVRINTERCKGCDYCAHFCPESVLALGKELNSRGYHYAGLTNEEGCTGCGICALTCPELAIEAYRVPRVRASAKT